jgi:hypothetical protein
MGQGKTNFFMWSLVLGISCGLLRDALVEPWSPLVEMSRGVQILATSIMLLVPLTGIVLGWMSWKRKDRKAGWSIIVIAFNVLGVLLFLFHLYTLAEG